MKAKREPRTIDFETEDRDFDELILTEYPGKLFEQNRWVEKLEAKRIYHYFGLDKAIFEKWAKKYKGKFKYQLHPELVS
jgi:hypothetical protein